jgi:hypothetical protein
MVGDYNAAVLYSDNGVMRNTVISLINITSVIPNVPMPKKKRRPKAS